jgi:hypothetical protein
MPDLNSILQEYSEKYVIAVEREQASRDSAYIADFDVIGDIKVHQLTPKLLSILTLMKSPFIVGGDIEPSSLLTLLWTLKIKHDDDDRVEFFSRVMSDYNVEDLLSDINSYFEDAFQDIGSTESGVSSVPYFSNLTSMVDCLASEYGWSEESIINLSYKKLFQYFKVIGKRKDPTKIMFNKSDSVKGEMIRKIAEAQET